MKSCERYKVTFKNECTNENKEQILNWFVDLALKHIREMSKEEKQYIIERIKEELEKEK